MIFKNICFLVSWIKVASALEGLRYHIAMEISLLHRLAKNFQGANPKLNPYCLIEFHQGCVNLIEWERLGLKVAVFDLGPHLHLLGMIHWPERNTLKEDLEKKNQIMKLKVLKLLILKEFSIVGRKITSKQPVPHINGPIMPDSYSNIIVKENIFHYYHNYYYYH